jgi:hypothetical protein
MSNTKIWNNAIDKAIAYVNNLLGLDICTKSIIISELESRKK